MKLIFCPVCQDVRALHEFDVTCACGKSGGKYLDGITASIRGFAIPLGFTNRTFVRALRNRPGDGIDTEFTAFVLPVKCSTIQPEK